MFVSRSFSKRARMSAVVAGVGSFEPAAGASPTCFE
jgi:hypothetical protein